MRMGAAPSLGYTLILVALFGVGLVATARIFPPSKPAVAVGGCPPPVDLEVLHVIVSWRDNRLVSECAYFAGRGTAGKVRAQ